MEQTLQSDPAGFRYVLLSELPNKGPRNGRPLQEHAMGQNHHALLAPGEHDIRSPLVLHEPWSVRANDGNYDVIVFVPLERVDVEHGVLPSDACGPERVLDRVSLGVVRGDDLEVFSLL